MIAITAGLCVLLAVPGFSGSESAAAPTPNLTVVADLSPDQTATLAALTQPPAMHPLLAETKPAETKPAESAVAPAAYVPVKPYKPAARADVPPVTPAQKHAWMALTALQHGTAAFDAWSTRESVTSGHGHEVNPLMKPFANSGAMYAAIQVAPLATDWWARRLMRSNNPKFRKLWWLPQVATSVGFTFSGVNNMRIASGR